MSALRASLWIVLGSLALASCVPAGQRTRAPEPPPDRLGKIFARFDHRVHVPVMERVGWVCVACHSVGAGLEADAKTELPPNLTDPANSVLLPPQRLCHTCHAVDNPVGAPSACRTCHETQDLPPPDSHQAGWLKDHAREAVLQPEYCAGCHTGWMCAQCHARRDTVSTGQHGGNWLSIHGMAARADPVSCEDCHQGDTCRQCHIAPQGRQGW